jgi:hypothetical protein
MATTSAWRRTNMPNVGFTDEGYQEGRNTICRDAEFNALVFGQVKIGKFPARARTRLTLLRTFYCGKEVPTNLISLCVNEWNYQSQSRQRMPLKVRQS